MKEQDLKDKFKIFVNGYVGSSMLTNTEYPEAIELNANKCVQIAKDYAEQEAIEFSDWKDKNTYPHPFNENEYQFFSWHNDQDTYTLKKLYQLFKNRENER